MAFLLDSNVVIDLMAQHERVLLRTEQETPGTLHLSSIVWFELTFGAFKSKRDQENLAKLDGLHFPVLPFEERDARAAGEIRAILGRAGTTIGPYDVLIAGQALARGLTLVTHNMGGFVRVDGLRLEDWRVG